MANPSVTHTFSNGTTADATQVNTNFTDIINSLTDGTKSLTIDALTAGGTATFNGAVTLGNGSPDDITVSGSLASSIAIKTNNSYDIGSATLGLASVYLGAPSSRSTRLRAHQSLGASNTLTLPNGGGTAAYGMRTDGSGNLAFQPPPNAAVSNYSLSASVGSSALTVALKGADGNDPSSTNPVDVVFRSTTAATGTPTYSVISAATSIVVTSGATLGHVDGQVRYVYVYLINGSGGVEIAVAGSKVFEDGSLASATAVTNGADSADVLYATSNHTTRPVRYIGRIQSTQATAGTWATTPSEVFASPMSPPIVTDWLAYTPTLGSGFGTTANVSFFWRRMGDSCHVRGTFTTGTCIAANGTFTLPGGASLDSSKISLANTTSAAGMMIGTASQTGATQYALLVTATGTSTTLIYLGGLVSAANHLTPQPVNTPFGDSLTTSVDFIVPISGWSSTR